MENTDFHFKSVGYVNESNWEGEDGPREVDIEIVHVGGEMYAAVTHEMLHEFDTKMSKWKEDYLLDNEEVAMEKAIEFGAEVVVSIVGFGPNQGSIEWEGMSANDSLEGLSEIVIKEIERHLRKQKFIP